MCAPFLLAVLNKEARSAPRHSQRRRTPTRAHLVATALPGARARDKATSKSNEHRAHGCLLMRSSQLLITAGNAGGRTCVTPEYYEMDVM